MTVPDVKPRKFYVDLDDDVVWDAGNNHWGKPVHFAGLLGGAVVKKYTIDYDDDEIQSGAGVSIWTPQPGEVLINMWIDLVETWNAPAILSLYPGLPTAVQAFPGAQVDLTQAPVTAGALRDSVLSMGSSPSISTETGADVFTIVISQDGTPAGGLSTSTSGKAVVYCETATPLEGGY